MQVELITAQAMKAGFYGGVVVDYPNSTKAKKFFLVLMTGGAVALPPGLGQDVKNEVEYTAKRERLKKFKQKSVKGSVEWIKQKKERRRMQGKETREDSKYSGRRRAGKF